MEEDDYKSTNNVASGSSSNTEGSKLEFKNEEGNEERESNDSVPIEISPPPPIQPTQYLETTQVPIIK